MPNQKTATEDAERLVDLMQMLASLKNTDECLKLMTDLCTPAELEALAGRWQVAQLIDQDVPYREVNTHTGVSTATITRVARSVVHGEGGYRLALNRRAKKARKSTKRKRSRA